MGQNIFIKSKLEIMVSAVWLQLLFLILLARIEVFCLRTVGGAFLINRSFFLKSIIENPTVSFPFFFVLFIAFPTMVATYSGLKTLNSSHPKKIFLTIPKTIILSMGIGMLLFVTWPFAISFLFYFLLPYYCYSKEEETCFLLIAVEALIISLISGVIIASILYKKYGKRKLEKISIGEEFEIPKHNKTQIPESV